MHHTKKNLLIYLLAVASAGAQYVPPSPAGPVPGVIDDYLLTSDPALKGWDFGINERVRYEDKDDGGTTHAGSNFDFFASSPTTNSNTYELNRLMPRIAYSDAWFAVFVELRQSYSFGDDRYTSTAPGKNLPENDGPLQDQMAYLQFGNLKEEPFLLKVGRQELNYGEGRLVGNAFWLNVPHSFDAVKIRYQDSFFGIDAFAARLVYVEGDHFEDSRPQDTLSGLYADFPGLTPDNVTELYGFARNVSRDIIYDNWSLVPAPFRFTAPQDLYTFGYRTKTKPGALGPWDYGIELMWQTGDRTAVYPATTVAAAAAAPRLSQDAWAFVLQGSYTWKDVPWTPKGALIVSMASGDKNATDTSSQTFQNLLPSNHGLYGMMDMSGLQNIEDYRLNFTVKPTKQTSLAVDLHQQYLENTHDFWYNVAGVPRNTAGATPGSGKGFGINPSYSPNLGQEADLIGGIAPTKGLLLEAGLGHFWRGPYIKESLAKVGSSDANYFYVQATINL
ncbi:MAG TPA: alginate export family protein [Opitutaceae bacterium]|jgi:hypothetical protein